MAVLLVPRAQVEALIIERFKAGESLAANAEMVPRTNGYSDWAYLFDSWRDHSLAELDAVYDGNEIPTEFREATHTEEGAGPVSIFLDQKNALDRGLGTLANLLKRLDLAVQAEPLQPLHGRTDGGRQSSDRVDTPKVFIIHGRTAGGFRESVARFIEQLGLGVVILAEQANEGRTLIEKFEAKALEVRYAIALLTPEDTGYGEDDALPPAPNRARQNVILELGYFMASLGRKNVVALKQEAVEVPTDILGIVYIPLDNGGAWKTLLARELQAAGYDIDVSKLLQ